MTGDKLILALSAKEDTQAHHVSFRDAYCPRSAAAETSRRTNENHGIEATASSLAAPTLFLNTNGHTYAYRRFGQGGGVRCFAFNTSRARSTTGTRRSSSRSHRDEKSFSSIAHRHQLFPWTPTPLLRTSKRPSTASLTPHQDKTRLTRMRKCSVNSSLILFLEQ